MPRTESNWRYVAGLNRRRQQGCIKLLDFSLSSIGWRRGLGRGGAFLLVAPLLGPPPLVPRGERMDSLMQPCAVSLRKDLLFFGGGLFVSWNDYRFYAESSSRQHCASTDEDPHARRWRLVGARAAVTIPAIPPPRRSCFARRNWTRRLGCQSGGECRACIGWLTARSR